jgi:hypothetical protein
MTLNHDQFRDISEAPPSLTSTDFRLSSRMFVPVTRIELDPIDQPSFRTLVIILNPFPAEEMAYVIDAFKALRAPPHA